MKRRRLAVLVAALAAVVAAVLFHRSRETSTGEPRIEIHKSARKLVFADSAGARRTFPIGLGFAPVLPKQREGDGRTPEGRYFVCVKNPRSKYYLSLGISYPGPADADRGAAAGLISAAERDEIRRAHDEGRTPPWKTALGGEIFIHGEGGGSDWTQGCVALENRDMAELFGRTEIGTPVMIFP